MTGEIPQNTSNQGSFYPAWERTSKPEEALVADDTEDMLNCARLLRKICVGALVVVLPVVALESMHVANQFATAGSDVDTMPWIISVELLAVTGFGIGRTSRIIRDARQPAETDQRTQGD